MMEDTDYSRHVFKELERANAEIENLKGKVIPELKKEYEAKLYDERASAAEKNSELRKEKDSEISELKAIIAKLESKLEAAENEVVRLKNMMNKDSSNSSKPSGKQLTNIIPAPHPKNTKAVRKGIRENV